MCPHCPDPPADLLSQVFPWIEEQQRALEERSQADRLMQDIALRHFLELLVWLRRVLLQDAALLFGLYPTAPIFKYAPFCTLAFQTFASNASTVVRDVEKRARTAFENLPEHLVGSLRGATTSLFMEQKRQHDESATTCWSASATWSARSGSR